MSRKKGWNLGSRKHELRQLETSQRIAVWNAEKEADDTFEVDLRKMYFGNGKSLKPVNAMYILCNGRLWFCHCAAYSPTSRGLDTISALNYPAQHIQVPD
jgi:hypothetical protein